MAWQTPKTDWTADDYYNIADINRWKNNLLEVKALAEELFGDISTVTMYVDKTLTDYPLASEINAIESNLETLNVSTYNIDLGTTKTYTKYTVPYDEINRIESAELKLYATLIVQKDILRRLAFTLGGARYFDVAR